MATLQDNPSTVPNAVQEWTRELNVSEIGRVGDINIKLTLWDETSTAIPNVVIGSKVEISGSVYVELSTVAINTASQVVDSINWLIYEVSGSVATAKLVGTAPTIAEYDVDKGGFYHVSGYRYTGHYMYVSPAGTAYSNKGILYYADGAMLRYRIDDSDDEFVIDANTTVKGTLDTDGSLSVTGDISSTGDITSGGSLHVDGVGVSDIDGSLTIAGTLLPTNAGTTGALAGTGTYLVPRGIYLFSFGSTSTGIFEVWTGSAWEDVFRSSTVHGGLLISDGTNVRHTGGTAGDVGYLKF